MTLLIKKQQILKILKDLLKNISIKDYMPGSQSNDTLKDFFTTIRNVFFLYMDK